jgi:hypothetical protein
VKGQGVVVRSRRFLISFAHKKVQNASSEGANPKEEGEENITASETSAEQ